MDYAPVFLAVLFTLVVLLSIAGVRYVVTVVRSSRGAYPHGRSAALGSPEARLLRGRGRVLLLVMGAVCVAIVLAGIVLLRDTSTDTQVSGPPSASSGSTPTEATEEAGPSDTVLGQEPPLPPEEVKVKVLNASGVQGAEERAMKRLKSADFGVRGPAAEAPETVQESAVLYTSDAEPAARVVSRELKISRRKQADSNDRSLAPGADIIVVIGSNDAPSQAPLEPETPPAPET